MNKKLFFRAFKDTIPVLAGYIVLGSGFGILLKEAGYGIGWAFFMSLFMYAGAMQYMAVSLITAGASLPLCALTTLMVNARHLFYGITMVDKYRGMGIKKPFVMYTLTDETYSLVCNTPADIAEKDLHNYYLTVSVLDHIYWICGCMLGTVIASVVTFDTAGVDYSLTALFITVFTDKMLNKDNIIPGVIGVAASLVCLLIFGGDSFLIPSMCAITVLLFACRKFIKEEECNEH